MSRPAIVSCAGIPDREEYRDGQDVLVGKQDTPTMNGINLKALLSFELDLSSRGTCQPVATLREGRVVSIAFTGPSATIEGPDGACRPILREVSEARFEEVKRINTLQNFPYSEACQ